MKLIRQVLGAHSVDDLTAMEEKLRQELSFLKGFAVTARESRVKTIASLNAELTALDSLVGRL